MEGKGEEGLFPIVTRPVLTPASSPCPPSEPRNQPLPPVAGAPPGLSPCPRTQENFLGHALELSVFAPKYNRDTSCLKGLAGFSRCFSSEERLWAAPVPDVGSCLHNGGLVSAAAPREVAPPPCTMG